MDSQVKTGKLYGLVQESEEGSPWSTVQYDPKVINKGRNTSLMY